MFGLIAPGDAADRAPRASNGTCLRCDVTAIPTPYGERTVPSVLWVDPQIATSVLVGPPPRSPTFTTIRATR